MAWFGLGRRRAEVEALRADLAELRSLSGFPWIANNPNVPFSMGGPSHPSQVETSQDKALSLAPVYAAIRILADGVASLPVRIYRDMGGDTIRWTGPSIFDKPSAEPDETVFGWLHKCVVSLGLEGNAFGYIASRDGMGFPTTIEWMPPKLVYIDEDDGKDRVPNPLRARYYYKGRFVPREDILHLRAFEVPGRARGISPLRAFAMLIGQGIDTMAYGADWFKAGGFPTGVFRNSEVEVDSDQSDEIKGRLARSIKQRVPLVIGRDWEYNPVRVPPEEAQFIQATQMNATQVAAIYGVPPERVGGRRGDSLTYATQEADQIALATDTLRPWLVRLEEAFKPVLPGGRYPKFNVDAMMRTDAKTKHEIYQIDRRIGLRMADEMRAEEDMAPLPDNAGKDPRPLEVLVAESRGAKIVPETEEGTPVNTGMGTGIAPPVAGQVPDQPKETPAPVLQSAPAAGPGARPPFAPRAWDPRVRASDREREIIIRVLVAARHAGRLSDEDFTERRRDARDAILRGELSLLVSDLPDPSEAEFRLADERPAGSGEISGMEARSIILAKRAVKEDAGGAMLAASELSLVASQNGHAPAKRG